MHNLPLPVERTTDYHKRTEEIIFGPTVGHLRFQAIFRSVNLTADAQLQSYY